MKKAFLLMAAIMFAAAPANASYDQALAQCKAFADANKISEDPCVCIAKAIGDDPDLLKEQAGLKTLEDFQNASKALRDAINPCVPPEQQAH